MRDDHSNFSPGELQMTFTAEFLLILSALVFGLRHGIDWDHIAAITDITGAQESVRQSLWLGTVYALGHGTVVTILGMLAVLFGTFLPGWVDGVMERVVGITLVLLGIYVIYSLAKDGGNFRMRSRWMLIFEWAEIGYHKLMSRITGIETIPSARQRNYGFTSAYLIGVIHGVGAETPTQLLLFIAAAGVAGNRLGIILVLTFIAGLLISNSIITAMSTFGFIGARKNTPLIMIIGGSVAIFSLAVGTIFLLGKGGVLPAFFGG
ncbi:MAG: hypothetical protein HY022_03630 [Chloroflexi bacterium]|nr:hypothetical protein [Chloroflexota bacterium]